YNAELRGLAQYYALACDVKTKLHKLFFIAQYSLFKTLANKHNEKSICKIIRRLKEGNNFIYHYQVKSKSYCMAVYQLKHLKRKNRDWQIVNNANIDNVTNTAWLTTKRTELICRLNANQCEVCNQKESCEVHHIRKLKDIERKSSKSFYELM